VHKSLSTLLDWRAKGHLHPHPAQVLPFESLPEGLDLLRSRRSTGKVVIRVQDP
jgi:NADPH:quinone reductase